MKKAVVVVSFGTTFAEAMPAIEDIEQAAAQHCGMSIHRAFTSKIVRRRLAERGIDIPDPHTLFTQLTAEGYDTITCLSTLVISGVEYNMLLADAAGFPAVTVTKPLLWSEADYAACVHAVMHDIPMRKDKEALVLMGHGTAHSTNAAYCQLERKFRTEGYANVYVGTFTGCPTLDSIIPQMQAAGIQRVMLMPFMVVAGAHARKDLSGDDEKSWKSQLEALGFEIRTVMKGLGEIEAIAQKFASRL